MHSPSITLSLADSTWTLTAAHPHDRAPRNPVAAEVPGSVHTDLIRAGAIPDPFLDENELDVAWVADVDWTYACTFEVSAALLAHDRIDIVFDGLDTLATIVVNGTVLAETANMHRTYRFDMRGVVHLGTNDLAITFASATRRADELRALAAPWPSASFGRPYNYIRKMACSWGWDWGPWLTTAGIWRAARVEGWSGGALAGVRPSVEVDRHDRGRVSIAVDTERAGIDRAALAVHAVLVDPTGRLTASAETPVASESGTAHIELTIEHVERWWPHSRGGQPLYGLEITLVGAHDEPLDRRSRRIGFRSIELDTSPDALGSAFTFVVNDRPLFARGVNWIPESPFPSSVTDERVRQRLQQARDANVDLVRVWGGGTYESDGFYESCDELGLMVWQDFCFACAAYPEELLVAEVEAEARDNVTRLMAHPSLVLWNGNNENIWGWFDWGWQRELDGRSWGAGFYLDLFPRVVRELDPGRPYWPGSPYSGSMAVAANTDAHGCTHVWDVWNRLDFDRYRDHAPRFVAEFGWQAPPTWTVLRGSISDEPLAPDSPGMLHHQKADAGNAKLARGLHAHLGEPADFETWWWATQLLQARAVTTGIEHFRSLRGSCMGTVWWQLNDCWPVTSWALVDSGGRRKPAWFALRDAYRPRLLTIQPRGAALVAFAINDSDQRWRAEATVRRITFAGEAVAHESFTVDVDAGSIDSFVLASDVATAADPSAELIVVDAADQRAIWWFLPDKLLALERPLLSVDSEVRRGGDLSVVVSAHNLVRDLTIIADRLGRDAESEQQLITLLPGESATITIRGGAGLAVTDLLGDEACRTAYSAITTVASAVSRHSSGDAR